MTALLWLHYNRRFSKMLCLRNQIFINILDAEKFQCIFLCTLPNLCYTSIIQMLSGRVGMAITVRDLLKLPYFEPVTVVAGQAGLDRAVTAAGILDYEYAEGYTMKEQVFRKNDLLVSSLLFAKDAPQNLLNMLQDLIDLGATGLAYKSVLIDTLPDEVLRLADEHDFPILKFGMNLYLEEFVFQIMDNVKLERQLAEKEELLDALIAENLPKEELNQAAKRIDSSLGHYLYSVYISGKKRMEYHDFERLYRGPTGVKQIDDSVTVCCYRNGYFLLFPGEAAEEKQYPDLFRNVAAYLDLGADKCWLGCSTLVRCPEGFSSGIQQAYFASICAQARRQHSQNYSDMGVYQFLIPNLRSPHLLDYMRQFLSPLLEGRSDNNDELLSTAIAYISEEGDIGNTAERLYCHKNTVRYRLNKLHERLCPSSSDSAFYEQLSIAVKIYLLCHLDRI